jgi:uncharacterized protein YjeT (DUF2065 family)
MLRVTFMVQMRCWSYTSIQKWRLGQGIVFWEHNITSNWRCACKNLVSTSIIILRKSTFSVKIPWTYWDIFCDVIPRVWRRHIMHLIYIYTVLTGFLLLLIPQLWAILFETLFYISRNRRKIRQDAAMIFASIDRGHSNLSNDVITSISTRLALTGFLHAHLQFSIRGSCLKILIS